MSDASKTISESFAAADGLNRKLQAEYLIALDEIEKNIAAFYAKYAAEWKISYAEATKYINELEMIPFGKKLKKYQKILDSGNVELAAKIDALAMKSRITRLEALKTNIEYEVYKLGDTSVTKLTENLTDAFKINYADAAKEIKGMAAKAPFSKFNTDLIKGAAGPEVIKKTINFPWSGHTVSENVWKNAEALRDNLQREMTQAFIQGDTVSDVIKRMSKRMDSSYKDMARVVTTETAHAINSARLKQYQDSGIMKVEFRNDKPKAAICIAMNGAYIKISEAVVGKNIPPLHPHCHSYILPVIDDDEGEDENDSASGKGNDIMARKAESEKPMEKKQFNRMKEGFERQGGIIDQSDRAENLLKEMGAEGGAVNDKLIYFTKHPTRSAVFEEFIHATQMRVGKFSNITESNKAERILLFEIEAQEKLIRNRKAYKIPNDETRVTIKNLRDYRNRLKIGRERGEWDVFG